MTAKPSVATDRLETSVPDSPRHSRRVPKSSAFEELPPPRVVREIPLQACPLTAVRSTLIASSLHVLRERKLLERYTGHLPQHYHDPVLWTLSPTWLSLDAALAHYRAIDALALAPDEAFDMGRTVGQRIHGAFLATLLRGARAAGFTPWIMLGKVDRVWARVFHGGSFGISMAAPREGIFHLRGLPLLEVPYFRTAFCGVVCAAVQSATARCHVREIHAPAFASERCGADLLVSWT